MSNALTPLVDFARTFVLEQYDPTIAAYVPVIAGVVTCYIAVADDAETAADPALSGSASYIGGIGTAPAGTWFFGIDAAVLTFALLDGLFNGLTPAVKPWLVVLKPNGIRSVEALKYVRVNKATIVP